MSQSEQLDRPDLAPCSSNQRRSYDGLIGIIHSIAGFFALGIGGVVLLRLKGGRIHKKLGYVYAVAMLVVNGLAFGIYRVFGGLGPFHALAAVNLAYVVLGVAAAVRRRPGWERRHYNGMCWSYVGLSAATTAEIVLRLPPVERLGGVGFGITFLSTALAVLGGRQLLVRFRTTSLAAVSPPNQTLQQPRPHSKADC